MVWRIGAALVVGIVLGVALGAPAEAHGAEAAPSIVATAPYDLDFTLPTDSKSGCMVCHGDPALVRARDGVVRSYYIPDEAIASSAHADTSCVGCHLDFTYKAPHGDADWTVTAKSSCRNCHEQASLDFGIGVHRPSVPSTRTVEVSVESTEAPKPLCGDCHGAHDISWLATDTPEARAGKRAIHADGWQVCGRCHEDYWDNYDDYYHGAAYKRGAADAPSCWDCHGWHEILPSDERASLVNDAHLVETCSGGNLTPNDPRTCHAKHTVTEEYVEYKVFIHGREDIATDAPFLAFLRKVTAAIGRFFGGE